MTKYKLIKSFPGSPEVGTIFTGGNGFSYKGRTKGEHPFLHHTYSQKEIESNLEFFAPYVFTTEDGVDIYVGDTFYFIDSSNKFYLSGLANIHSSIKVSGKVFSTKAAAQKYIDDLNPYKEGEWLYFDNKDFYGIFRYKSHIDYIFESDESYWYSKRKMSSYDPDIYNTGGSFDKAWNIQKATVEQIENILSKVALNKGFKEGIKFKSAWSDDLQTIQETWFSWDNGLYTKSENSGFVYYSGKWAEIVKNVIPEYVECISIYPPLGATTKKIYKAFYKLNDLHPYRWITNESASGENGYSTLEMFNQIFKPSTKEAYDAQFISKLDIPCVHTRLTAPNTFTIMLENGYEVNSVGFDKNEVKIKYQVK